MPVSPGPGGFRGLGLLGRFLHLVRRLAQRKRRDFNRVLSLGDYFVDRWEKARFLGWGEGSSVYDACLVLGQVDVGRETWIGPYTILDGSGGGLTIGNHCSISAGVHIYTHDTVDRVIHGAPVSTAPVHIGDHCYIGPNAVISKGVTIGDYCVVGANSFVNKDVPSRSRVFGTPAVVVGETITTDERGKEPHG